MIAFTTNYHFLSTQKSKVDVLASYTLDTLSTLAFQKPCYYKVLALYVVIEEEPK